MMTRLLCLTATALHLSAPAMAQQTCAPRDLVLERLTQTYGESRQSIGLAPNTGVVEVFASTETGTWTIVITTPNGQSCLIASGQAYETLAEMVVIAGDDA